MQRIIYVTIVFAVAFSAVQVDSSGTPNQKKTVEEGLDNDVVRSLGGYSGSHGRSLSAIRGALKGELSNYSPSVNKLLAQGGAPVAEMFGTFLPTFKNKYRAEGSLLQTTLNEIISAVLGQVAVPGDIIHRLQGLSQLISPDVAAQTQQAIDTLSTEIKKFGHVLDTFLKSIPDLSQARNTTLIKCLPKLNIIVVQVVNNPCMALCAVIDKTLLPPLEEAANKQNLCGSGFLCNTIKEVVKKTASTVCDSVMKIPAKIGDLVNLLSSDLTNFNQCLGGSSE